MGQVSRVPWELRTDGVLLDPWGAPQAFRLIEDSGTRDVPASQVLHVFEPEHASAVRNAHKRAAVKAAQIAAEMGSPVPAKITPKGNNTAGSPPPSAAAVWNRQFAAQA